MYRLDAAGCIIVIGIYNVNFFYIYVGIYSHITGKRKLGPNAKKIDCKVGIPIIYFPPQRRLITTTRINLLVTITSVIIDVRNFKQSPKNCWKSWEDKKNRDNGGDLRIIEDVRFKKYVK